MRRSAVCIDLGADSLGVAYELGELRVQYQEEIGMMRVVCHDAIVAAQHLGLDVDMLKREAVALAEQENKVNAITDHMERKESHYREKGRLFTPSMV